MLTSPKLAARNSASTVQSPNSSLHEDMHHRSPSSSSGTDEGGWGQIHGKERDGASPAGESSGSPHSGSLDSDPGRRTCSNEIGDVASMSREDSGGGASWHVEGIKREVGYDP